MSITYLCGSRSWPVSLFVFALTWWLLGSTAHASEALKRPFDLAPGAAETSLKQFSLQSGLEVLFISESVASVRTHAVKGSYTPREAIDLMLANTQLIAVQDKATGALRVRRSNDPNG